MRGRHRQAVPWQARRALRVWAEQHRHITFTVRAWFQSHSWHQHSTRTICSLHAALAGCDRGVRCGAVALADLGMPAVRGIVHMPAAYGWVLLASARMTTRVHRNEGGSSLGGHHWGGITGGHHWGATTRGSLLSCLGAGGPHGMAARWCGACMGQVWASHPWCTHRASFRVI